MSGRVILSGRVEAGGCLTGWPAQLRAGTVFGGLSNQPEGWDDHLKPQLAVATMYAKLVMQHNSPGEYR